MIWEMCRRYSTDLVKQFPDSGTIMDQDAHTMIVLEVIDELFEQANAAEEIFQKARKGLLTPPKIT